MKKEYKKPQVTQVRLALKNPVLANCNDLNPNLPDLMTCNEVSAPCAPVGS